MLQKIWFWWTGFGLGVSSKEGWSTCRQGELCTPCEGEYGTNVQKGLWFNSSAWALLSTWPASGMAGTDNVQNLAWFQQYKQNFLQNISGFLQPFILHRLKVFLTSNFCHVLNVVCFLLGNSLASEFYMLTFQNALSFPKHWHIKFGWQGITQKKAYNNRVKVTYICVYLIEQ